MVANDFKFRLLEFLTVWSRVATMYTTWFYMQNVHILPTQCIYVLRIIVTITDNFVNSFNRLVIIYVICVEYNILRFLLFLKPGVPHFINRAWPLPQVTTTINEGCPPYKDSQNHTSALLNTSFVPKRRLKGIAQYLGKFLRLSISPK
jgi:hypothetical protein